MTLTIDIPDDVAARVAGMSPNDLSRLFISAVETAVLPVALSETPRRSIRDFAGVGAGRPGAVGGDVEAHIRALRDGDYDRRVIVPTNPLPWEEFFALMVEGVDPNRPPLSDYVLTRESIYED